MIRVLYQIFRCLSLVYKSIYIGHLINSCLMSFWIQIELAGLQIISRLAPVKLSGQTYFCSDISHFWPDKHRLRLIAIKARVIKYKPQGIYWPPAQGGGGGEDKYTYSLFFFLALRARFAHQHFWKEWKEK